MKRVLCFGEALIDFHGSVAAGVEPAFTPHAGGAPANVAVGIARLGGRALFVGMLARDAFGDYLLRELGGAAVDVRHVARTALAPTALAFVTHAADGERSFSFYRPPAADLLFRAEDFAAAAFDELSVFHACSNSLTEAPIAAATLAGMERAREAGALVSFDLNLRPALWPRDADPAPRLWQALARADLVKLSAEELAFLASPLGSEDAVRERLWAGRARWLVVTAGAAALRWFTPAREGALAAFPVHAVDTTAAGDAFTAGLLFRAAAEDVTAKGLPDLVADDARRNAMLRFAAACGALAVTRAGSFSAMPTHGMVDAFLQRRCRSAAASPPLL